MNQSLEEIEMQDGELKIDSDFYSVENGVYLSMYDSTGYFFIWKDSRGDSIGSRTFWMEK